MEKIGEKVYVNESWDDRFAQVERERRIVGLVKYWVTLEEPPAGFNLEPCDGYRVFVYPAAETTDEEKHRLLAWFVRRSGKKFYRFVTKEGRVAFWNNDPSGYSSDPESDYKKAITFSDGDGEPFEALFLFERPSLGKCRIVEVEEVVKVKKLVCEGEDPGVSESAGTVAPAVPA